MVGAGVIGLELGSVWRRLGVEGDRGGVLRSHPARHGPRSRQEFQRILAEAGHEFRLGVEGDGVERLRRGRSQGERRAGKAGGAAETVEADVALIAIGRVPYTEGLGLDDRRGSARQQAPHCDRRHFEDQR